MTSVATFIPPRKLTVGIGDAAFCGTRGVQIKTYGLGSCVAVCFFDPKTGVTGMVHVALPESALNPTMAAASPFRFADTAINLAVEEMRRHGAARKCAGWHVKIAGGAAVLLNSSFFNVGKKNQLAVKKALWANGMAPIAAHCGGGLSRTVTMYVGSPRVDVRVGDVETIQI